MIRLVVLVAALLLPGCAEDPAGDDARPEDPAAPSAPGSSGGPGTPAPPPASTLSLPSCQRNAFLGRADEQAVESGMAPGYDPQGDILVSIVFLLVSCPVATIGNATVVERASVAITYAFLADNSTADSHAYALEVLASDERLVSFFAAAGFTARLAMFSADLGLQGGTFTVETAQSSYEGTVAGAMDADGDIPDQSFLFTQSRETVESNLLHVVTFDSSSVLIAAATIVADGGALAEAAGPAFVAAADHSMIDGTFEPVH